MIIQILNAHLSCKMLQIITTLLLLLRKITICNSSTKNKNTLQFLITLMDYTKEIQQNILAILLKIVHAGIIFFIK